MRFESGPLMRLLRLKQARSSMEVEAASVLEELIYCTSFVTSGQLYGLTGEGRLEAVELCEIDGLCWQ